MQIHELTQPGNINEGLWDQVKSAAGSLKQGAENIQDRLKNRAVDSKITDIANRTAATWRQFAARRAAQDPNFLTDVDQYRNELKLFLVSNLLPKYTNYNNLTIQPQFEQVIDQIVAARATSRLFPAVFKRAAELAAVAQVDPNVSKTPAGGTAQSSAAPTPTPNPQSSNQVSPSDAVNILNSVGVSSPAGVANLAQLLKKAANSSDANRTGNSAVDALLQALGFNLT